MRRQRVVVGREGQRTQRCPARQRERRSGFGHAALGQPGGRDGNRRRRHEHLLAARDDRGRNAAEMIGHEHEHGLRRRLLEHLQQRVRADVVDRLERIHSAPPESGCGAWPRRGTRAGPGSGRRGSPCSAPSSSADRPLSAASSPSPSSASSSPSATASASGITLRKSGWLPWSNHRQAAQAPHPPVARRATSGDSHSKRPVRTRRPGRACRCPTDRAAGSRGTSARDRPSIAPDARSTMAGRLSTRSRSMACAGFLRNRRRKGVKIIVKSRSFISQTEYLR